MEAQMSNDNKRPPRRTNEEVVEAFMTQTPDSAGALTTDGQSLFSYNLRIAEHVQRNGGACTIIYDYTSRGGAFKSQTTSSHVGLAKQQVPRCNVMLVETATEAGLIQ
tara:strand:+ start:463 stop:786 length:324 start_codon:yes stop_codon:yes gene_type:complete